MFFITRRIWKRYYSIVHNVDTHFLYESLNDAIDAIKICISSSQVSDYCFVRITHKVDVSYKISWSQTFDHEGSILTEFKKYDDDELIEKTEKFP